MKWQLDQTKKKNTAQPRSGSNLGLLIAGRRSDHWATKPRHNWVRIFRLSPSCPSIFAGEEKEGVWFDGIWFTLDVVQQYVRSQAFLLYVK